MEDTITQEKAIQMALNDDSILVTSDGFHNLNEADQENAETVYSLASLYSQFCEDSGTAETAIVDALCDKHGNRYR